MRAVPAASNKLIRKVPITSSPDDQLPKVLLMTCSSRSATAASTGSTSKLPSLAFHWQLVPPSLIGNVVLKLPRPGSRLAATNGL